MTKPHSSFYTAKKNPPVQYTKSYSKTYGTAWNAAANKEPKYTSDIRINHGKITPLTEKGKGVELSTEALDLAQNILCRTRPSKDVRTHAFVKEYIVPAVEQSKHVAYTRTDAYGNFEVVIKHDKAFPTTMFTAHVDTVLPATDKARYQEVMYDATAQMFFKTDGRCLGADDGTGIALMLHMIKSGTPGLYVFFHDEECGRIGSSAYMAEVKSHKKHAIHHVTKCVSFDRKGDTDIITMQSGRTCASDAFASALSTQLHDVSELKYTASPNGSYTDSYTFIDMIPECTNLSVGYKYQHGPSEEQHIPTFDAMIKALPFIDWEKLPAERDPKKPEPKASFGGYGGYAYDLGARSDDLYEYDYIDEYCELVPLEDMEAFASYDVKVDDMSAFITLYPNLVARVLVEMGHDIDDLEDAVRALFPKIK